LTLLTEVFVKRLDDDLVMRAGGVAPGGAAENAVKRPPGYLIGCEDAVFGYEGNIAVPSLTFFVMPGERLCVIGKNGTGKTTLLRGLLGLIRPMRGRVLRGENFKANEIGYLPQEAAVRMDFPADVFEVVLSGCVNHLSLKPFYSAADRARADEYLRRLGLADLRGRCYRELSGGQRRRVLLARSFCASCKLLVLDEPAAGLDSGARADLYRALEEINRDAGTAIIMVSHDLEETARRTDTVLRLEKEENND
jgi:zinc transport system ATP-binding protein